MEVFPYEANIENRSKLVITVQGDWEINRVEIKISRLGTLLASVDIPRHLISQICDAIKSEEAKLKAIDDEYDESCRDYEAYLKKEGERHFVEECGEIEE